MAFSRPSGPISSLIALTVLALAGAAWPNAPEAPPSPTLSLSPDGFDQTSLLAPEYREQSGFGGFSLLHPQRFSMAQSYSVSFTGSSSGSSGSGLYLNTLSYQLAQPLVLSVDLGVHTPLYSTFGGSTYSQPGAFQQGGTAAELVLPRIGLDYKPSDNLLFSIQWVNGEDAWKAYGPSYFYRH